MTTPEGKVKTWANTAYKTVFPGHWRFSPRGGPFGKAGTGDHIMCWGGVFIMIEVKATVDDHPTALQTNQLKAVAEAGGVAAVLRGKDLNKLYMIRAAALKKMKSEAIAKLNEGKSPEMRVWINECPSE
jgi:hypothetical protein